MSVLTVVQVAEMHFIKVQVLEYQVKEMMVEIALQVVDLLEIGMAVAVAELDQLVILEQHLVAEMEVLVYPLA